MPSCYQTRARRSGRADKTLTGLLPKLLTCSMETRTTGICNLVKSTVSVGAGSQAPCRPNRVIGSLIACPSDRHRPTVWFDRGVKRSTSSQDAHRRCTPKPHPDNRSIRINHHRNRPAQSIIDSRRRRQQRRDNGPPQVRCQFRYCHATAEMITQMGRAAFRRRRRQGIGARYRTNTARRR